MTRFLFYGEGRIQDSFINMSANFKWMDYFLKTVKHRSRVFYIELYTVRFLLISLISKQTSTVIYNRLSVITDGNKSASSSYFESCLPLVNSPCFHTSMHFTGGSPFYALAPCLKKADSIWFES